MINTNTRLWKRRFIRELSREVTKDIIQAVPKMPEDWNGIELRQYIADKFTQCVISGTMPSARKRAYKNTCVTQNL